MTLFGQPCITLSSIESTNNYLAEQLDKGTLTEGTAILTYDQHDGRGQFGNSWQMQKGKDMAITYYLKPKVDHARIFTLNKALCLGVRSALSAFSNRKVHVKWPNDIYIKCKKVSGLLIEPSWKGDVCKHVIFGIGINVNSDPDSYLFKATSLREELGDSIRFEILLSKLHSEIAKYYSLFDQELFEQIESDYQSYLLGIGQKLKVNTDDYKGIALIKGVDKEGRLICRIDDADIMFAHRTIEVDYSGIKG